MNVILNGSDDEQNKMNYSTWRMSLKASKENKKW